jgi:adenosine deaminase
METLEQAKPFASKLIAVGLDNAEVFGEPKLFESVYASAKAAGIPHAVAHAAEEGKPDPFVKDSLDLLKIDRVDHGVQTILDATLTKRCAES